MNRALCSDNFGNVKAQTYTYRVGQKVSRKELFRICYVILVVNMCKHE